MKKEFVNRKFTDTLGYAFTDIKMPKMRMALGSKKEQAATGLQSMQVQQMGQLQERMTMSKRIQFFRCRHLGDWVVQFPSKRFRWVYLIFNRKECLILKNNYGGQMPGYLAVGFYWSNFLKHGVRWCWIVHPED